MALLDLPVPHGIMFHHFTGEGYPPSQGAITADQFRRIVDGLGRHTVLSADEWIDGFQRGTLPPNARCLTFDDALRCQYEIALPVLEDLGLKAMFFVYTAHFEGRLPLMEIYRDFRSTFFTSAATFYEEFHRAVESLFGDEPSLRYAASNPATWPYFPNFYTEGDRKFQVYRDRILTAPEYDQVMSLMMADHHIDRDELVRKIMFSEQDVKDLHRSGHIVGLHSHTHPLVIYELSREEQRDEFASCAGWVEKLTGSTPIAMSHPAGVYSDTTLDVLSELGIRIGFRATTELLTGGALEVPRFDHTTCRIAMRL